MATEADLGHRVEIVDVEIPMPSDRAFKLECAPRDPVFFRDPARGVFVAPFVRVGNLPGRHQGRMHIPRHWVVSRMTPV